MTPEGNPNQLRFRLGIGVFALSFLSPLLIPLVVKSELSTGLKATVSGLLAFGIPELGALIAVAILGKPGYEEMKRRLFAILKRHGPPEQVGVWRHRIGLVMFVGPLLFALVQPYAEHFLIQPDAPIFYPAIAGDVLFFSSFFVLGGAFWEKLRALFVHGATAVFPDVS